MQENKKRFWLDKFDCFSISGNDAMKFVNGITSGNIINTKNKVCKTCLLNPNGVLRSLIEIIFQEQKLELVILEGDTNEIREYFNKIIFPADDVSLSQIFSINRVQEVNEINSWKINQPIFLKNDNSENSIYLSKLDILNANDFKSWKINQAIPSLDNEIDGKNNPLELGLSDLIDFNKGCFLGQETMSKIKNVSSLKQEIRVWNSSASNCNLESENMKIYANSSKEKSVGKITSFHKFDSKIKGLAMVKRKYLEKGNSYYSEIFGQITIKKSIGSNFL